MGSTGRGRWLPLVGTQEDPFPLLSVFGLMQGRPQFLIREHPLLSNACSSPSPHALQHSDHMLPFLPSSGQHSTPGAAAGPWACHPGVGLTPLSCVVFGSYPCSLFFYCAVWCSHPLVPLIIAGCLGHPLLRAARNGAAQVVCVACGV